LIGMGDSDKLPNSGPGSYSFVEYRRFLDALLETLGVFQRATLVVHDWGSALGFDWANRHRDAVTGIVYLEALVRPLSWDEFQERRGESCQALRSPGAEAMLLERLAAGCAADGASRSLALFDGRVRRRGGVVVDWPRSRSTSCGAGRGFIRSPGDRPHGFR
jgi:pimeloyl-ACP methyl ester carboxylesterase